MKFMKIFKFEDHEDHEDHHMISETDNVCYLENRWRQNKTDRTRLWDKGSNRHMNMKRANARYFENIRRQSEADRNLEPHRGKPY